MALLPQGQEATLASCCGDDVRHRLAVSERPLLHQAVHRTPRTRLDGYNRSRHDCCAAIRVRAHRAVQPSHAQPTHYHLPRTIVRGTVHALRHNAGHGVLLCRGVRGCSVRRELRGMGSVRHSAIPRPAEATLLIHREHQPELATRHLLLVHLHPRDMDYRLHGSELCHRSIVYDGAR